MGIKQLIKEYLLIKKYLLTNDEAIYSLSGKEIHGSGSFVIGGLTLLQALDSFEGRCKQNAYMVHTIERHIKCNCGKYISNIIVRK